MLKALFKKATFTLSAPNHRILPEDSGAEVAFVGRSNAGKSSTLNALCGQNIAKTSKTPGRTQAINVFSLNEHQRLIDLPGYGYAKVPMVVKQHWQTHLDEYLRNRRCLKGAILLVDIRHPLKEFDEMMINWSLQAQLPLHILLTKADKLKRGGQQRALLSIKQKLPELVRNYQSNPGVAQVNQSKD